MESRAKALGHAIHPVLIPFPLGLLTTAVVFDVLYLVTDRSGFTVAAAYALAAGILGGAAAGVFGHDFGSPIAAWCALLRPDVFRSVALMSAPFVGPPPLPEGSPPRPAVADASS